MSKVFIQGVINNIRAKSTPYTPITEAITNAIDAIDKSGRNDGEIRIQIIRNPQLVSTDGDKLADVTSVEISDNGIGFNKENRDSFDTIYSQFKRSIGGRGFGRFFYLRHFNDVHIESTFIEDNKYKHRSFDFGKQYDVIVNDKVSNSPSASETGTTLRLLNLKGVKLDKDPEIISHRILEQILSYFSDPSYTCPQIIFEDDALDSPIVLNGQIGTQDDSLIQLKKSDNFTIKGTRLRYKMFKILKPRNQKSKIILTARNQAVTEKSLDVYIPDFYSDFTEDVLVDGEKRSRNYIIRFYVQGEYLEDNVTVERDSFNFGEKHDPLYPVSGEDIEKAIAEIAKKEFEGVVSLRSKVKREKFEKYAQSNIWYKPYIDDIEFETIKANPTEDDIELILHKVKYERDLEIKQNISQLTSKNKNYIEAQSSAKKLIREVKDASYSDLAQYIAFRKSILELFKKTLEWNNLGEYDTEKAVHDIIFPTKSDSNDTVYDGHNLWIIDEGLNLTQYLSSDKNIFKENKDRPDIAAFHYGVSYREGNDSRSNPVSVFEFKRPGRYDFSNLSSQEDPVSQIVRYVNNIRNGNCNTPAGREIKVSDNTPFYGYIVADVNSKVREWLECEKNFKPTPDGDGWYYLQDNINLQIKFITWDKLLKDATVRHRIFFEKLGLEG